MGTQRKNGLLTEAFIAFVIGIVLMGIGAVVFSQFGSTGLLKAGLVVTVIGLIGIMVAEIFRLFAQEQQPAVAASRESIGLGSRGSRSRDATGIIDAQGTDDPSGPEGGNFEPPPGDTNAGAEGGNPGIIPPDLVDPADLPGSSASPVLVGVAPDEN